MSPPHPIPITFLITDLHRGGSPLILATLATALQQRGHIAPRVISIAPLGEIADILRAENVPVKSLNAKSNRDLTVLGRFLGELRAHPPKILCSILIHANLLATIARPWVRNAEKIRWIQCIHTLQEEPEWHWQAQGVATSFADAFIAPSHAIVRKLEGFGPVPKPIVIPNGIDIPRFRDAIPIPPNQRPWPAGTPVIGYLGRFDPVKRLDGLIQAIPLLKNNQAQLALVGYGAIEADLRQQVRKLNLASRVHFLGATPEPERWLKAFTLMCSPSSAEGFGLTLIESLIAGTPVIACRPGVQETLAGLPGVAWLDADPSAQEISQLLDQSLVKAIAKGYVKGMDGLLNANRFAQDKMIAAYEAVFVRLASSI